MGRPLLISGWVKSSKASWSRISCFISFDVSALTLQMGIDLARLSFAIGEGCFTGWPSELVPWQRDVGDGLSLGVGTVRVGDTLGFGAGWCSNGERSLACEAGRWRESLGFGLTAGRVGEEFGLGEGEMEVLGFAERYWELHVLGLVLGRVEALSPWFLCECWHDLLLEGGLGVLDVQIESKDLERKKCTNNY